MLFPDRTTEPELIVCSDTVAARRESAVAEFGYREATDDWRSVCDHPDVDVVVCTGPNMLHLQIVEAACTSGKHVFCEKPVGGTPEQTARAAAAARRAGVISGVGYNYRFAPLVRHAADMIRDGQLGTITSYRGRFLSMYGADPLGVFSWRFEQDQAGYGASTDLLSHSVDLAQMLVGRIARVTGLRATFIPERALPSGEAGTHYGRGAAGAPTAKVTNEDYTALLAVFESGAPAIFEASRAAVGPESQMAFDVFGTEGSLSWNLERMNEMQLYLAHGERHTGYTTVFGGDRFRWHGAFVPGSANGIGFEDLVAIEDFEFLESVGRDEKHEPGFEEALAAVEVQAALIRSWDSEHWEDVEQIQRIGR
jgi:predicted dehydrogenase